MTRRAAESGGPFIELRDNGPGIDAAVIDTLFEPFRTTKISGMGIGLSITREIVELHGGRVEVESVEGEGASFRLVLPTAIALRSARRRPTGERESELC